jgi:hypothetical protein
VFKNRLFHADTATVPLHEISADKNPHKNSDLQLFIKLNFVLLYSHDLFKTYTIMKVPDGEAGVQ